METKVSKGSYEAINEQPRVFCAYSTNVSDAMKEMATILNRNGINWINAVTVNFLEEDQLWSVTSYT